MKIWRRIPQRQRTLYLALAMGVILTLVTGFVLEGLPFFQRAELATYDWRFQLRGDRALPSQIVVVGVDQTTLDSLSGGQPPIPRADVARSVDFLRKAGARAICIDFFYPGPSRYGARDDQTFAAALRRARGRAVIDSELSVNGTSLYLQSSVSLSLPYDPLARAVGSSGLGLANIPTDSDGATRRADLLMTGPSGQQLPSFPLQCAATTLGTTPQALVKRAASSDIYVNFNGSQNPGDTSQQTFRIVEFDGTDPGQGNALDPPSLFRNKTVLIIPAAISIGDTHQTPYGLMYGGFLQANTLNTILRNDPIVPAGDGANRWIIVIVGLLATILAARFGIWQSTLATLALAGAHVGLTFLLFQARYWVDLVTPMAGLVLVFAAVMALRFATEERIKRRAVRQFGQYVRKEIAEMLVDRPAEETGLRGARRPITCLFVDIRGFTAMSERMEPEQVVTALDVYLEELTLSVEKFSGTTDKYVGDELMAIWNAPFYQEDHALLGVKCALDMVSRADFINQQLTAKGLPRIGYGIGVNSGEAVVGEMGGSLRKHYTGIGDTVNTGARLCSAAGRSEVIIGQRTWEMIGEWLDVEETEPLRLKGKSEPLRTFRVLAVRESPMPVPDAPAPTATPEIASQGAPPT